MEWGKVQINLYRGLDVGQNNKVSISYLNTWNDIYLPLEYSECEDPVKFIKRLLISYIVIASDISGQLHYFLFK